MFVVSFNEDNTIRMIGAPNQILPPIKEAIKKHWNLISGMGYTQHYDSWQLILDGQPFRPHGKDTVQLRMMLLQLLATIKARGYRLETGFSKNTDVDGCRFARGGCVDIIFENVASSRSKYVDDKEGSFAAAFLL
ncbi:hypothetical protein BGZ80_008871 [Entomortierella chlamydospora]|uniref:Uncharacterized protein n=1 Tax=Entomortierella chlamydospora TaxID=101097 RepID=A0A9P6MWZ7_9FUNG|nr:hypothetical protein BGZ80_008871 [Entomortierella chlamydospora]